MNRNFKRFISTLIIVTMLLTLNSCGKEKSISESIKIGHGGAEMFVEGELTEEIVACINTNDVERMKSLMSNYALGYSDWDKTIMDFYSYFPDDYTPTNVSNYYSLRDMDRGKFVGDGELYECKFDMNNNGKLYHVYYVWLKHVPDDETKQGIHSIILISDDAYKNKDYKFHGKDDTPGVYIYNGDNE